MDSFDDKRNQAKISPDAPGINVKPGDRVQMPSDWRTDPPDGSVMDVSAGRIIIKWDGSDALWYYNEKDCNKFKIVGTQIASML